MEPILFVSLWGMEADSRNVQVELDDAGMIIENKRGTQIPSPLPLWLMLLSNMLHNQNYTTMGIQFCYSKLYKYFYRDFFRNIRVIQEAF